ncbi:MULTISPECIES: hypothetical protein [Pseudovibrio]|uniref:hypothetical protein n=1 Tax=Stappiaceae TaxID=2821832 RepID=UPI002365DE93|nr:MULTISPECIES: hypothetical protein [Pseudovibrio]MDD7910897.1 hypothetical protein [Pseudovibrio exalbescens]MDX5593390.1 hypothetical protein [Pseudovibrio sp. SPO723]
MKKAGQNKVRDNWQIYAVFINVAVPGLYMVAQHSLFELPNSVFAAQLPGSTGLALFMILTLCNMYLALLLQGWQRWFIVLLMILNTASLVLLSMLSVFNALTLIPLLF